MAFYGKLSPSSGKIVFPGFRVFAVFCLLISIFVTNTVSAYAATPAEGQAIFEQKCKSCHTIGGGRLVGPDLKGISANRERDWLIDFISVPDKLIARGDPIARQIVQEYGFPMPNVGVSEEDAEAILAYIDSLSPAPTTVPALIPTAAPVSIDPDTGRDLFTGKLALKNGGPACLSCHNVNSVGLIGGGTVGKDLTAVHSLLGETAVIAMMKTMPFPIMKAIYAPKPLTDDEISSLIAFLKEASAAPSAPYQNPNLFWVIGVVGALSIIGLFQWLWRGRLTGVRRQLVKGGSK